VSKTDVKSESREFQAEVAKILKLMVHSVYSDKEVFLRELISNASDACDKLRYSALTQPELISGDPDFRIEITIDKAARTIRIADNGIGMDHQELIENLGTIARSGTGQFIEQLTGDAAKDSQLIGQFGVGFYSSFMVAKEVEVVSLKAGDEAAHMWRSTGEGTYEVAATDDRSALLDGRGTAITLHLQDDEDEFLDRFRLQHVIKRYSDHIALPIHLKEVGDEDADESNEPVNAASALWMRPKSEITEDQYKEFYHNVGHTFDDPAHTIHYKAEGRHEYSVLLFLPTDRPMDLFDPNRQTRVRLYVKRVFITDEAGLLPGYLRFVRGIVDSEDMPLNISREMLQNNPIVGNIRSALTKRVLNEIAKKAEKDSEAFDQIWSAFGPVLKEGLYEDGERREQLLDITRFETTTGSNRSLKDYLADLKENQTAIYYLHGDDPETIRNSPLLEGFKARGLEVLLLSDPVDAFWTGTVFEHDGKPLKSIAHGAADLDQIKTKDTGEDASKEEAPNDAVITTLITLLKQTLEGKIADVTSSDRLTDSPVCLVAAEGAMNPYMERILAQSKGAADAGDDVLKTRILEINPKHELIKRLAERAHEDGVGDSLEDAAYLLLDQARIIEGEPVVDAAAYAKRLARVMGRAF